MTPAEPNTSPFHGGDTFAHAALALSGDVCGKALADLGRLMREQPVGAPVTASRMADATRRIALCLDAAEEALAKGDPDSAALEWARAQVLAVEMNRRRTAPSQPPGEPYQKSGTAR
jgi:hypothetical protein